MTHVHAPVIRTNEEIATRAREIHPAQFTARILITTVSAVFIALGWTIGRSWFAVVFTALWAASRLSWLWSCSRMGYHLGRKNNVVPERE